VMNHFAKVQSMIERGRVIFLILALIMRMNGSLLLHISGQRSHAVPHCACLNCPGERICCCPSAESPAEALKFSAACDQPFDETTPSSAKDVFTLTPFLTFDLGGADAFLLPRSESKISPPFASVPEPPPRMA
jgi:hypothetical protein